MSTLRHAQLLLEHLNKQRNEGFLCDFTVVVGQSRYQAHRNVLAAFSEFFASRCAQEGDGVTTLDPESVSEATFQTLLAFVYTGNLIISNDDVSDIRKAAAFLGIQEALNQCDLLCPNEEKPSLDAIIQACNAMAAAEAAAAEVAAAEAAAAEVAAAEAAAAEVAAAEAAAAEAAAPEATAEPAAAGGRSPSTEPVDMLPSLQEVEESEEQENTEQREHQDSQVSLTSEPSPPKEPAAPTGKKRGRKPKPKPDVETPAVVEEVSASGGWGRGRGRPRGRGRGRPAGSGRGRGRPPKQVTAEPVNDEPSEEAEPAAEAEAETETEAATGVDDPDSAADGENSDPLNLAKARRSHRKRVPSKKLRESTIFAEDVAMEEGDGEGEGEAEAEEEFRPEEKDDKESLRGGRRQGDKTKPMCSQCGKLFSEISSLRRHQRIHIGLKPYECMLCNRTFRQCNQLKTHLRIHTGEKPFKCDKCDKAFAQKCQLVFHCRMHHGEEKPYQCNDCGLQFATSSNLKIHSRKHSGEKPYKCAVCAKRFAQASTLTYHMRRHTGEKPYICDTCGRAFAVSSSLITHTRKHTKEKLKKEEEEATCNAPYVCLVCGKRFFTTGELRKHMDSHGYKRVKCDICGQMLADANGLKKHKEKKHSVVLEETLTSAAVPLNIPIDHQGLIARMCASPLDPSDVTEATSVTFEQLGIPADAASSLETTQIVIVHTIQAE
ncbi:hypothetical protein ACEWY4_018584 [Coilia grayii]|uniref:Myoneurin n=1 Tax=Coilia grayii TaxID=363190 RepID=A0ABD1JDN4_9TELE